MSSSLSASYWFWVGGQIKMSHISCANSGCSEDTTWAYLFFCAVMLRVRNCASTCANQIVGSFGQKGGSLRLNDESDD